MEDKRTILSAFLAAVVLVVVQLVSSFAMSSSRDSLASPYYPERVQQGHQATARSEEGEKGMDFVFAELTTTTACPYCKYAHQALMELHTNGEHPLYFVSLVTDRNTHAYERYREYKLSAFPTAFFDGGYRANTGVFWPISVENQMAFYEPYIADCANRTPPDIDVDLVVEWLGDARMDISVSVQNNEASNYEGYIRVYITEIASTMGWHDGDIPYAFAFLDYAFDEGISIHAGNSWESSTVWDGDNHSDGDGHDFGGITRDNIFVVATVYNAQWHQGESLHNQGHTIPFDAYYLDGIDEAWTNTVFQCGDCNGDGLVTFADALYLRNYYYQRPPGSPAPIGEGDVNLDGKIAFGDALYISNYYHWPGYPEPCNPPVATSSSKQSVSRD